MIRILVTLLMLVPCPALAGEARVIDGDGLRLGQQKIRLWGVDAPERAQQCVAAGGSYACGQQAKTVLTELVRGKDVRCETVDVDRYRRTVARCSADGQDLGGELVRLGWALDYRRYSKGAYLQAEAEARRHHRGLWEGSFEQPWIWRQSRPRR